MITAILQPVIGGDLDRIEERLRAAMITASVQRAGEARRRLPSDSGGSLVLRKLGDPALAGTWPEPFSARLSQWAGRVNARDDSRLLDTTKMEARTRASRIWPNFTATQLSSVLT